MMLNILQRIYDRIRLRPMTPEELAVRSDEEGPHTGQDITSFEFPAWCRENSIEVTYPKFRTGLFVRMTEDQEMLFKLRCF
jgi:hypothetical protein